MVSNEIELMRKNLINMAMKHGVNAIETIECSQKLDILLLKEIKWNNEHYFIKKENK
ncbi:aspartyl-phosphate phosphatase Spo0E family protein [Metabacillus sediminilitoris]|uniref:Aspartyl-phosphate phosphatase Spo0E family protein n=1 Tax=Metabacillus sediminilitoris TaxID=2567941 RepID=A0A4S4BYD6_9BACI|nr:aspartyl-phosphate phosphatase Spo0E family protein [Metabacillus sediminilitoris]QGQ44609.1 Spo0E family sporulation regulatory protein-aspartic acid phosphatase [Metabacillus sediminilitoris]THF80236.1 aspartyl-phosphate phosphatase Spo0E family protein [Metabacillus sediminilitoris]